MRYPRRQLPGLVLLIGAVALAACNSEPVASDALQAEIPSGGDIVGFFDFSKGTDKSFGIFLCVTDEEVTLESVAVVETQGEIELMGGLVYRASDGFVGAVDGYPPEGLDASTYAGMDGEVISVGCDDAATSTRTQLVVGAERLGPGGGVITGLRIFHDDGFLEVPGYTIVLCGDRNEHCEQYGAPEG